jgi:hypothetical protein
MIESEIDVKFREVNSVLQTDETGLAFCLIPAV